ncbi:hypothetical protein [Crocosphaera chwakensis]|uniref:Uncharacterized protein n=1 Tax=Crocosphaera chwakensis CCY0110 TaxID=391612 RepID=A3ITW3_9CHRO|nr:hypothetical protein [Crocosphaera chwakensis]EAZ90058.1 hypothetical protein CY0110_14970 [Crocosphaera chwakensis CCY0110]
MNNQKNKHIAEQIAKSFNNNNDESFIKGNFKKFEKAIRKINQQNQLTSLEQTGFIEGDGKILADSFTPEEKQVLTFSPYKYPNFLAEQSPESLKKQLLQTFDIDWLNPPDSES